MVTKTEQSHIKREQFGLFHLCRPMSGSAAVPVKQADLVVPAGKNENGASLRVFVGKVLKLIVGEKANVNCGEIVWLIAKIGKLLDW